MNEGRNEAQYIHTTEYSSERKRNKLLIRAIAWMHLKTIMQGELGQFKKKGIMYSFIDTKILENTNYSDRKHYTVVAQALGK